MTDATPRNDATGDSVPDFARALGAIPSGLFIATAGTGTDATGTLVSFVQQVGFEPPVVAVAVKKGRPLEQLVRDGERFCVTILDSESNALLGHFARGFEPGQPAFDGIDTALDGGGVPYPTAGLAWLSCRVVGEADWTDHVLFAGEVEAGGRRDGDGPLVHVRKNGLSY